MRFHPYASSVPTAGVVHVPEKIAPFERIFTDVVERQVDIFPNPQNTINSSNAGQIVSFDMPTNNFLDLTATGKPLELECLIQTNQLGDLLANNCGFIVQNVTITINNEQINSTIQHGQLNSMWQNATSDKSMRDSINWAMHGGLPDKVNSQSLNSDGSFLNHLGWGETTTAIPPATQGAPPFVTTNDQGVLSNFKFVGQNYLYNIPEPAGMTGYTRAQVLKTSGIYVKIPLDIPGGLLGQKKGLIPLFLIPRLKINVSFNPSVYCLFSKRAADVSVAGTAVGDYTMTNLRISLNCIQSLSLQKLYKQGMEWTTSFLGFNYFTSALQRGTAAQMISISAPFRSLRALVGYIANPSQFVAGVPVDRKVQANQLVATSGNSVCGSTNADAQADDTRWDNFYGLGGCSGGYNGTLSTALSIGPNAAATVGPCYRGQDSSFIVNVLNFQVNNEQVYQQDLSTRTQMWDELIKVIPEARRAPYFDESNYPGIHHIIAVNLQSPSLSENFINGNRAADGNALCYLKIGWTANPNVGPLTSQILTTPLTEAANNIQFICWAIHDRVLKVNIQSGATGVQY